MVNFNIQELFTHVIVPSILLDVCLPLFLISFICLLCTYAAANMSSVLSENTSLLLLICKYSCVNASCDCSMQGVLRALDSNFISKQSPF